MWFARPALLTAILLQPEKEHTKPFNTPLFKFTSPHMLLVLLYCTFSSFFRSFISFSDFSLFWLRSIMSVFMPFRYLILFFALPRQPDTDTIAFKSLFPTSCHLCFWPPWLFLPPHILLTNNFLGHRESAILSIWPSHLSLFSWRIESTLSMLPLLSISVFLNIYFIEISHIDRAHLLTKDCNLWTWLLKGTQVSQP